MNSMFLQIQGNDTAVPAFDANRIVAVTASTLTVTQLAHSGKIITLSRALGIAVTLPNATGTGAVYTFVNITALSGGSHVITRGVTGDSMAGYAGVTLGAGGAPANFPTASNSNVITLNATTTGGAQAGDYIQLIDMATNLWYVACELIGTSALATPFTHT